MSDPNIFICKRHAPEDSTVRGQSHRVDLNLGGILIFEDTVQVDESLSGSVLRFLSLETQLLSDGEGLLLRQAILEIDGRSDDGAGVFGGNLLDVHASLCRRNEDNTLRGTIVENGDVILVFRLSALCQHDLRAARIRN